MGQHLAGFASGNTASPREVLLSSEGTIRVAVLIDGSNAIDGGNTGQTDLLRAGWILGKISSTHRFVPCKRTRANGAGTSATALVVDNAAAFKVGDAISIGGGASTTISAIVYSSHQLTLAAARTWSDDAVVAATDGSATPRGVLLDNVDLQQSDESTASHKSAGMLIQGAVQVDQLLGDVATVRLDVSTIYGIRFSDDYGL